jgi:hypothetical membrane protein
MATDTPVLAPASTRLSLRWLALGAIVGPAIFTLTWLVLGVVSPGFTQWGVTIAPYSPISAPISGLGLGPTGPFMNAAFVGNGVLVLVGLVGIGSALGGLSSAIRRTCLIALSILPLASIGNGIFTLETGGAHFLVSLVGLASPVPVFLVVGLLLRRAPEWRRLGTWLVVASPMTLVLVIVFFATFTPTAEGAKSGVAGLTERILIVEVLAWYVALGWHALHATRAAATLTPNRTTSRP